MEPSIYTRIIRGELPCHKVYESDNVLAFMDIHPIQPGMVLVIVKQQIEHIEDVPDEVMAELMLTAKKVMRAQRAVFTDRKKIGMQVEGLEVPHVHVKLFPFDTSDEFRALPKHTEPNHEELSALAVKIKGALK